MEVYKAECAEILRRYREHRINHRNCIAGLDSAVANLVMRMEPDDLPIVRGVVLENNAILKAERAKRAGPEVAG
jgi:hypothetical protein